MLSECLDDSFICLGVPFIALRQLGAVGDNLGRKFLPSVEWRTRHRTTTVACPVRDFLPNRAQSTVAALGPLAHRTLSGAPCRPLELPCVARRFRGRPLALATVGSPDSPVNYSHVTFSVSQERRVCRG
jgi:hypothetical protein